MTRWTTIKVPKDVYEKFKFLRSKTRKAGWELLLEAISFYDTVMRRPKLKADLPSIERVSWYITKLSTSFGAFKENPTKDNFDKLRARINELKIRLGVDGTVLIQLAEKYLRSRDIAKLVRIKQDMNMAYKQLIKDLILKAVSEDTSEGQAQ